MYLHQMSTHPMPSAFLPSKSQFTRTGQYVPHDMYCHLDIPR